MFGTDLAPDLLGELRSYKDELRMEDAGFWARITVEYCSRAEMLLWVLSPWKLTYRWIFRGRWKFRREKYARTVEKFWGFVRDEPAKPPYSYRKWNFPLKSLARDQRPSLS